jgi:hypothetical protein
MAETSTHTGGCHCGAVRYRVKVNLDPVITCNCSICSKTGTMLAFTPESRFELTSGADALTDYQFGKKRLHHLFCRHCGVRSFGRGTMPDGTAMVAVNVRCLDDVDLESVKTTPYDGRSRPIDD